MKVLVGYNNAKTRSQLAVLGINYNVKFENGIGSIYISEEDAVVYLRSAA